ncbi:MAG: methyltransferase [Verrucomicrobiota bacterium]
MAFYGRTLEDYRELFALDEVRLRAGPVLDVAAGPSSFALEATLAGAEVVAVDPLYRYRLAALRDRAERDTARVRAMVAAHPARFRGGAAGAQLLGRREVAAERFLADYAAGRGAGRYRAAALPQLPFPDDTFETVLCAHFLFLYAGPFDHAFHLAACRELCRVARGEVLLYPLCDLTGTPYARLEDLLASLAREGIEAVREPLEAPMLLDAGERLRLRAPPPARRLGGVTRDGVSPCEQGGRRSRGGTFSHGSESGGIVRA